MTQNIKMDKTRGYLAHNNEIGHSKKGKRKEEWFSTLNFNGAINKIEM